VRDVDLRAGLVYVGNQVAVEVGGRVTIRDGGKSSASTRTVPLPEPAVRALRGVVEPRLAADGPDGRVFVTATGTTPLRSNFSRIFQRAVRDAGLEGRGLNVRQLRHTAATLMLSSGLDVLDVQQRLGHAHGSVTLDVYGRVLAGRRTSGTERLAAAMTGPPVAASVPA
jgi:integrase